MPQELRQGFHRALDRQEISIGAILEVIPEAVGRATTAMLDGDEGMARELARWRSMVTELNADVDSAATALIARQAPVAGDLRLLLAVTRLVPVLADTMDLVADIVSPALAQIGPDLPERTRLLCAELGASCAATWSAVAELWRRRERPHFDAVRSRHDTLAEVRSSLTSELASGSVHVSEAMLLAMTGRSYERIGRHAGAAARLIEPLVGAGGELAARAGGRSSEAGHRS